MPDQRGLRPAASKGTGQPPSSSLWGIILMVGSMFAFSLGDAGIKALAATMSLGQIFLVAALVGTPALACIAAFQGQQPVTRAMLHPSVLARMGCEFTAAIGMALALATTPLSLVAAVIQAVPLLVTFASSAISGISTGWRRWLAIFVGLAGVMIILRPGAAGFEMTWLWSVLAMLGLAGRDLSSRYSPVSLGAAQLSTAGFAAVIPAGIILWSIDPRPVTLALPEAWLLLLVIAGTIVGALAITAAMRTGEVAVVAPFRYSRLLFGILLGVVVFGERPDALVYVGAALVAGAGIYTLLREARQQPHRESVR